MTSVSSSELELNQPLTGDLPRREWLPRLFNEEQERILRYYAARTLIQVGSNTDNLAHAENCFEQARLMLERLTEDFEEGLTEEQIASTENPFSSMLSQSRYRLAQISLIRGDIEEAANGFLQVILCDPNLVPRSILAFCWYDMGLIWLSYGSAEVAKRAFREASGILRSLPSPMNETDELLLSTCQHAAVELERIREQNLPLSVFPQLPHSIDITALRYRNGFNAYYGVYEEVSKLFNHVFRAAGAA